MILPKLCPVIPTPTKMAAKLKIEKRGDEIKKISSPLKLPSQSQPNFAEMIIGWSPFKIVSVSAVLKFIKNPVIYVKKLIMLIQFKFGHFLA
jgi:hypothetical protein